MSAWIAVNKCFFVILFFVVFFCHAEGDISKNPNQSLDIERNPAAAKRKKPGFTVRRQRIQMPKSRETIRKIKRQVYRAAKPPSQHSRRYFEKGTDEAELESVINDEINQLFNLIKTSSRRDLRLRLGSLYIEKVRLIEYRLYEEYDKQMNLYKSKKRKTKPKLNLGSTYVYVDKAVKLFETYRRQYPKDKYMAQVLFFLGVAYFKKGQFALGKKRYQALLKRFPKSEYVTDVNFEMGEHHFNMSQWKPAIVYYRKIAGNQRLKLYSFALYKLAWCYFNTRQLNRALANMEAVIREGARQKSRKTMGIKGAGSLHFANEAVDDLSLFYSNSQRSPAQALTYFESQTGDSAQAFKMLKKLGEFYMDYGNLKGVRTVFKQLIATAPRSPSAYQYQYEIIRAHTSAGQKRLFLKELKYWLEHYGPSSTWAKYNRHDYKLLVKARDLMERTLRNYALRMHQSYRKTKDKTAEAQALLTYKLYHQYFSSAKTSDQMRFFYAELLFDSKKYNLAGRQYQYIVENYAKSKYYEPSSLNSVLAFEKTLPKPAEIKKLKGAKKEPVAFPPAVQNFQKVSSYYMTHFAEKSNAPAIVFKKGELYYDFNQNSQALAHFWHIIKKYPTSSYTEHAGNLILDVYNKQKDFPRLKTAAVRLLENPYIARSKSARDIHKIISQIGLKSAETAAKSKQYYESARLYKKFADENPSSPLRMEAYYNAGFYYKKSGDKLKALSLYQAVLQGAGASTKKLKTGVLKQLPDIYRDTGQYAKSAGAFSSYAKSFPNDKSSVDFLFNSALIYDGLNRFSSAEQAYLLYFRKSRKAEKSQALYLLAKMLHRNGQITKASSYYNQFLNRGSSDGKALVESAFNIAEINKKKGKKSIANTWYRRTINLYKQKQQGVFFAAQAEFNLVHDTYLRYVKIKIAGSPSAQKRAVQTKLNLLAKLKEDLKKIIRYDSGEQVAGALVLIGLASEHIGDAIYNSPLPRGLNKQELAQYKAGLQKTAQPFKTEAVNNYELALKKSKELNSWNIVWLKKAQERLGQHNKSLVSPSVHLRKTIQPVFLYDWTGS